MILSEKLLSLRRKKGLSQEELANMLGISRQAVHKWETTQSKPDIDNLMQISKIFGVTLDSLLNDTKAVASDSKKELGEVITDFGPDSENLWIPTEYTCDDLFPKYAKKEKKLKIIVRVIDGLFILILAAVFVFCNFMALEDPEFPIIIAPLFVSLLLAILLSPLFLLKNLFISIAMNKIQKKRETDVSLYNRQIFLKTEELVKNQNYDFCTQISPEFLSRFFCDKKRGVCGIFGKEKEIFICPIQNYVNITFDGDVFIHFSDKNGNLNSYYAAGCIHSENETIIKSVVTDIKTFMDFEKAKLG